MLKVYIASPYTIGDVSRNVRAQIDAADIVLRHGGAPFWPVHSHFHHMVYEHSWEEWMRVDLEWVKQCDALWRLPGESKGADREVAFAKEMDIPVFYASVPVLEFLAYGDGA